MSKPSDAAGADEDGRKGGRRRGRTSCEYESGHVVKNHMTVIRWMGGYLKER